MTYALKNNNSLNMGLKELRLSHHFQRDGRLPEAVASSAYQTCTTFSVSVTQVFDEGNDTKAT